MIAGAGQLFKSSVIHSNIILKKCRRGKVEKRCLKERTITG